MALIKQGAERIACGGAIGFNGSTALTVTDTEFKTNTAASGGAVYLTSGSLTLKSSKAEGNTAAYGGAIYAVGDIEVKVESTTFKKNVAEADGGAIYGARADINVSGAETCFTENAASRGGAVYLTNLTVGEEKIGAVLDMMGGKFAGNTAEGEGGAVHIRSVCSATFNSTAFETNNAGGELGGGAIYAGWATLGLNSVTMTGNGTEKGNGGAVCSDNSAVSVIGGEFKNNSAANGGAIYALSNVTVDGASFESNVAVTYGGAIYLSDKNASVNNASFKKNRATYGGAIGTTGELALLSVNDAVFSENTADDGGAIYSGSSAILVDGSKTVFSGNSANRGGAIYLGKYSANGSALTMNGGSFENNVATVDGGAVSIRSNCIADFISTVFTSNTASGTELNQGGGAIYVGWGTLNLDGVTMTGNKSMEGFGSAINADNATFTVKDGVVIEENSVYLTPGKLITVTGALEKGSVITVSASDGAFASVDGTNVTDVSVYKEFFRSEEGKPVYVKDNMLYVGLVVNVSPTVFNDFTADSTADTYRWYLASDADRENVLCEGKTLTGVEEGKSYVCVMSFGDHSVESDPVIYYAKQTHPECGADCGHSGENIHENIVYIPVTNESELIEAVSRGGNYYLACDIEISGTLYAEKEITLCLNGKILSAADGETAFTMLRSYAILTITDCRDTERAGYIDPTSGLWVEGSLAGADAVTLKGGIIMGGHGQWGGAINSTAAVEIYNVNFVNNTATSSGGAIYVNGAYTLNVHGMTFVSNSTAADGGAVYLTAGIMTADGDNRFLYNMAARGGAIYLVSKATITMTDGSFAGNTSTGDGGAVHIRSNCVATFNSTAFDSNSASGTVGGGAIFASWGTLNLNAVTMADNTITSGTGSAVHGDNATVNVSFTTEEEKTALDAVIKGSGSSYKLMFIQQ